MKKEKPKNIHFLGIGGSGASAAAVLAKKFGYKVSGCNNGLETPYIEPLKKNNIKLYHGHDNKHLLQTDILATTPALFFSEEKLDELEFAKKNKKVISWQKFVGEHLLTDKKVICVAGTHGKSTTTAMLGLVLEDLGVDPSVLIGARVIEWKTNFRYGRSEYFLIESDEFYNNFLNYHPDYIILNNIEYDHPDFFKSEYEVFDSFRRFISQLKGKKVLIANQDSPGVLKVLNSLSKKDLKELTLIGYTTGKKSKFDFNLIYRARKVKLGSNETCYDLIFPGDDVLNIKLNIIGLHNVYNSLGVLALVDQLNFDIKKSISALNRFKGIGQRLELVSDKKDIKIYDDYAHHPTAIETTLRSLRIMYPKNRLIAIIEPHSYSRTKKLIRMYKNVFNSVDKVVVGPIYKARDKTDHGVSGDDIVKISQHKNIKYIDNLAQIIKDIKENVEKNDVIIVMGAGNSYKWSKNISEFL